MQALASTKLDLTLKRSASILMAVVWLSSLIFGLYILSFYVSAIGGGDLSVWNDAALPDLYEEDEPAATAGIGVHFATGAVILILGGIQFVERLRLNYPKIHRATGKIYIGASFLTAVGGLTFIVVSGTIGGAAMNVGFALYGLLMLLCTIETYRHARAQRFDTHNQWAMRLYALAIGSWLYRMSYGFWVLVTGGLGIDQFKGPFDYFMDFAFYIPSLIIVELIIRSRKSGSSQSLKWTTVVALGIAIVIVSFSTYGAASYFWLPIIGEALGL